MTTDLIAMGRGDSPLVALAAKLGYTISIQILRDGPPDWTVPRYRGDLPTGATHHSYDLLELLTEMIEHDRATYHTYHP